MHSLAIQLRHILRGRLQRWPSIVLYRGKHTSNARFEQVDEKAQPQPLPAQNLIEQAPVEMVDANHVYCDGGSYLGHPRIFINLVFVPFHPLGQAISRTLHVLWTALSPEGSLAFPILQHM